MKNQSSRFIKNNGPAGLTEKQWPGQCDGSRNHLQKEDFRYLLLSKNQRWLKHAQAERRNTKEDMYNNEKILTSG